LRVPQQPSKFFVSLAALLLLSCQDSPPPGDLALSPSVPPASLLRLPGDGGHPVVYRLPRLTDADWATTGEFPPLREVIGADLDQRLVFAADSAGRIVALDLENGKVRAYLSGARSSIIGPDGVLFTVDDSNHVTRIARRNPTRLTGRLPGRPRDLFGTLNDEVFAVVPGSTNQLITLSHDQPVQKVSLPAGEAAAPMWGDMVAIAADSAVVLYDPEADPAIRSIEVDGHARSVAFSASGHRIFVARSEGGILEIDRFTDRVIREIELPGPARALRPAGYGQWLLVRPASSDSVWVVDLTIGRYLSDWSTRWSRDLPTVAGSSILLLKQRDDVVAHDLSGTGWPETGRVRGGGSDLWLPLAWTPEAGTRPTRVDTLAPAVSDTVAVARVFLQVSSSQNPDWAEDLARQLRDVGLTASVLKPRQEGEGYRVVLGPYDSRETAEAEGRKLGRPFFIYQPEQQ
jgi:hypothetical protein